MRLRWISYAFAHTRAFKTALAVTFCVSLTAAAETKTRTYNQDFELDRSNFSYPLCPEGSIWSTWNNSLESQALWNKEWAFARDATLDHVHFDDKQGVFMNINKTAAMDLVMFSQTQWYPPLTLEVDVKSTGAPGVPSTLNVRNDTKTGEEIDFIIASRKVEDNKLRHFLSVPLYKSVTTDKPAKLLLFNPDENSNEVKVDLGKDVYFESNSSGRIQSSEKLSDEARRKLFQENWAISWDGFEPQKKLNTYVLHWNESSITWSVGSPEQPVERIKFTRIDSKKDVFPKGPLPLRFGPWTTGADDDWAGRLDWEAQPTPIMQIKQIRVVGCKMIVPAKPASKSKRGTHHRKWRH